MNASTWTLDQYSQRLLNLLGMVFAGLDVRVLISHRAVHPATVVFESNTVVLDPWRTNLYDLALCSRLLTRRRYRSSGPADPDRKDRWLTRKARLQWATQIQHELQHAFPGILQLPGRFRPGESLRGLRVVAKSVEWTPLPELLKRSGATRHGAAAALPSSMARSHLLTESGSFEFEDVPELEITGAEEDYAWLIEALEKDYFPLQRVPGLDELPFLRIPFRLCLGESCPRLEAIEQWRAETVTQEMIRDFMKCYRDKSEVRQERLNLGRHTASGIHLDTNRLVDALLARRVGLEPRLFRKPGSVIEPVFDPQDHLVVLTFDINDLRRSGDWLGDDLRSRTHRFLAMMLTTYQQLEVDCVVLGFADQFVTLPDGRTICLHFSTLLKDIEQDFGVTFWNRLDHLLQHPPQLPGIPTCYHPLALQEMAASFERVAQTIEHSYRTIVWWARRSMHRDFPQFWTTDFLMRMADHIDHQVLDLERAFRGTLDTLASFLPRELKDHGRPGQYLQQMAIP